MRDRDYDEYGEFIPEEYNRKSPTRCEGQYPQGCHAITMEYKDHLTAAIVAVADFMLTRWPDPTSAQQAMTVSPAAYGYISKLGYWEIAEQCPAPKGDTSAGWWRLTPVGIRFLEGDLLLRPTARRFRNVVQEYLGDPHDADWFRARHRKITKETMIAEWEPHEPEEEDDDDGDTGPDRDY